MSSKILSEEEMKGLLKGSIPSSWKKKQSAEKVEHIVSLAVRKSRSGFGPIKVTQVVEKELQRARIEEDLAAQICQKALANCDWEDAIANAIANKRRLGNQGISTVPLPRKSAVSMARFLQGRGFEPDHVEKYIMALVETDE